MTSMQSIQNFVLRTNPSSLSAIISQHSSRFSFSSAGGDSPTALWEESSWRELPDISYGLPLLLSQRLACEA